MRGTHLITVNYHGGLVSPGHLLKVLELVARAQIKEVRFGLRQQLVIDANASKSQPLAQLFKEHQIAFSEKENESPNITTSYANSNIFSGDTWLTEGVFKDLLDELPERNSFKINILDRNQGFCPWFTGHINWIASNHTHYWHLALRYPGSNEVFHYPWLFYTNHVVSVTATVEAYWNKVKSGAITETEKFDFSLAVPEAGRIAANALPALNFQLPYYEGFNPYDSRLWLGIYRREETYPVDFLAEVCRLCLRTRIGMLYTTPWKSIIIKNIEPQHRDSWLYLLGNYRINVRHASNELNWQVEDNSQEALLLKRFIIREFDREDVRTFGLCFGVQMSRQAAIFGSIRIQRDYTLLKGTWRPLPTYSIYHTPQFDPNGQQLIPFRQGIKKEYLPSYLIGLCRKYYEELSAASSVTEADPVLPKPGNAPTVKHVHQCPSCLTVYDPDMGDPDAGIEPHVIWENVPECYSCFICGSPKSAFRPFKMGAALMEG